MMERKWMLAILVAALSVIVLQFFIRPVYVSDDDVLYLLTLSGGLGHSPSNLVHVSYGWHPLYGWLVKTFFIYYPHLNWYTVFLLLFHTFGLSAICYFLLSRFKFATGLLVYFLLFIVFEVRLLQHLDFTGSAMICAIGGCLVLSLARKRNRYLYSGACLVLAALLLRFHIAALVVILFAPLFIFPLLVKNIRMMVLCLCSIGVCWLLLHKSQIEYYNRAVPNWKERSAFRDDFFYLVNHATSSKKQKEIIQNEADLNLLQSGFLYDPARFNTTTLSTLKAATVTHRNPFDAGEKEALYWTVMENKIYLCLLFLTFIFLYITDKKASLWRLSYALLPVMIWLYLMFFLKTTPAILFAFFLSIFFYLLDGIADAGLKNFRYCKWYAGLGFAFMLLWSGKLICKTNVENKESLSRFNCFADMLKKNSDFLFVATNFNVAIKNLPIWLVPEAYKLDNLLYYQRILIDNPENILRQHGIAGPFPDWLLHKKIRLTGTPLPFLKKYCFDHYRLNINIVEDTSIKCGKGYKIHLLNNP